MPQDSNIITPPPKSQPCPSLEIPATHSLQLYVGISSGIYTASILPGQKWNYLLMIKDPLMLSFSVSGSHYLKNPFLSRDKNTVLKSSAPNPCLFLKVPSFMLKNKRISFSYSYCPKSVTTWCYKNLSSDPTPGLGPVPAIGWAVLLPSIFSKHERP